MAKAEKPVVALVKLTGGTQPLDQQGIILLNNEVITRKDWYASHPSGTPRKPYTGPQNICSRAHEAAKKALVIYTGNADFKLTAKALGYSPQYAPRTRIV